MKKCPECNSLVEDNLKECPNCGYPFDDIEITEVQTNVIEDIGSTQLEEKTEAAEPNPDINSEHVETDEDDSSADVTDAVSEELKEAIIENPQDESKIGTYQMVQPADNPQNNSSFNNLDEKNSTPTNKKKKISKKTLLNICKWIFIVILLIAYMNEAGKNSFLSDDFSKLQTESEELKSKNQMLESENEKLTKENITLQNEIDELENGAASQLVTIKNAYEKGEWQNVIDLAAKLHEKYNGSEEDKQAQEMAKNSQAKIDEAKAAKAAEEAKGYETGITYDQLARTPDDFMGKKVKFYGKVVQVIEGGDSVQIRLAVNDNYDTILLGEYSSDTVTSRVLEDDYITIYGVSVGTISYESTMGGTITIPGVYIDKIDQ